MSSCCHAKPKETDTDSCHSHGNKQKIDWVLTISLSIVFLCFMGYVLMPSSDFLHTFVFTIIELAHTMWWGVLLGILFVGIMHHVPREMFQTLLGRGDTFGGLIRATLAGLLLDLCSHGILMVGAKLYERGASLAQVMAFLIASPWNSLSLTIILISLVGWQWTAIFIIGSAMIALLSGVVFLGLTSSGVVPENPNSLKDEDLPPFKQQLTSLLSQISLRPSALASVASHGWDESKRLIKWLVLGMVIAGLMRAGIPPDSFAAWFGPTLFGLIVTLVATTIIEVCSEGSTPIAAEILHNAHAPGNAFTFLMAGVATDYTEVMIIREFTGSWKTALMLPLVTVPQVIILGMILNGLS